MRADVTSLVSSAPLNQFCVGKALRWIENVGGHADRDQAAEPTEVVCAYRKLQDVAEYRQTIRDWFAQVVPGGHLIIVVPHAFLYERKVSLPSPWHPQQRRIYTPASLLAEVEEALPPNSYRVRWLGDLDDGYDYLSDPDQVAEGESDIALVLEKIEIPAWSLDRGHAAGFVAPLDRTDFAFEPERTRIEQDHKPQVSRILVQKLDHLGDLIMALPALDRLRRYFADATIDLVVGSWNVDMARDLQLADRVIGFDAFPRNSSEEEPNVPATLGFFRGLITDDYDLAIDLRTDIDTRPLLRVVKSRLKAGIGTRARFPYLDIALPLDSTRNDADRVRDDRISPHSFSLQGGGRRTHFALYSSKEAVERDCAIVWGPYLELDPGEYIFDFYIDIDEPRGEGLIRLDVAVEKGRVLSEMIISGPGNFQLKFRIDKPNTPFEARISTVDDQPSLSFGFHGGRLIKRGPGNVLHQTEYMCLLVELVKMRVGEFGMMADLPTA